MAVGARHTIVPKCGFHTLLLLIVFCLLSNDLVWGQSQTRREKWKFAPEIRLKNASLESPNKNFVIPPGWEPHVLLLAGTDIKDVRLTRFYSPQHPSQHKANHIALAAYSDGTRENIGQQLSYPVIPGLKYSLELWLSYSPYETQVHPIQSLFEPREDFRPVKLQIYGFASDSDLGNALLAETPVIDHREWKRYKLTWQSTGRFDYIYLVPSWQGTEFYDGNIHVDNLSIIKVTRLRD